MNELDFDELDKAVNSLMGGMNTEKRNTALDDPEDTVVTLDGPAHDDAAKPVAPAPATNSSATLSPSESPQTTPAPASSRPAQPLAVKRRGQFMDMVHPSSDMKTVTSAPRREGVTVQPSSPFVPPALSQFGAGEAGTELKPEPAAPVLDVVTPAPSESPEFPASPKTEEGPAKSEWPDPIDMDASVAPSSNETEVPSEVIQEVASPVQDEPLSSPFLPDAKVEKRPLGGGSTGDMMDETPSSPSVSTPAAAPDVPPVQLPEELKTDVMALESTSTSGSQPGLLDKTSPTLAVVEQAPIAQAPKKEIPQTGSGSIPQQYTEQPSTSNQTNTPIYDTSTHQPLEGALKKSSSMKWIILALVLLIIGAIAGAAYFYFTTR